MLWPKASPLDFVPGPSFSKTIISICYSQTGRSFLGTVEETLSFPFATTSLNIIFHHRSSLSVYARGALVCPPCGLGVITGDHSDSVAYVPVLQEAVLSCYCSVKTIPAINLAKIILNMGSLIVVLVA